MTIKFSELDLPAPVLAAINKMGFEELTPIQEQTYPIIAAGNDLCALAETGSGKTAACAIPLIQMVDPELNEIQGLVVVPTRELCLQYVSEIQAISCQTKVTPFAIFGGFSKEIQIAKLNHEVHILVATPGRLIDLLYGGKLSLNHVRCAILDEADELLKEGFFEDIEFILSCIRHKHQTLMFSATMPADIKKLAHDVLHEPTHITLIQKRVAPKSIEHHFAYAHPKDKHNDLVQYLKRKEVKQAIIFCNARLRVEKLFKDRRKDKGVEYIHGGLSQDKRTSIIRQFRSRKIRILIATDVAGRGLDFSHVSHIINWAFPDDTEQYTHRTGRAGRMGRKGIALTFITRHDLPGLRNLIRKNSITPIWLGKDPFLDAPKTTQKKKRTRRESETGKEGGKDTAAETSKKRKPSRNRRRKRSVKKTTTEKPQADS